MGQYINLNLENLGNGEFKLNLGFGKYKAWNTEIILEATEKLKKLKTEGYLKGGKLLLINGPATTITMFFLGHQLAHIYSAIAICDPKEKTSDKDDVYIVAVSHSPDYPFASRINR